MVTSLEALWRLLQPGSRDITQGYAAQRRPPGGEGWLWWPVSPSGLQAGCLVTGPRQRLLPSLQLHSRLQGWRRGHWLGDLAVLAICLGGRGVRPVLPCVFLDPSSPQSPRYQGAVVFLYGKIRCESRFQEAKVQFFRLL